MNKYIWLFLLLEMFFLTGCEQENEWRSADQNGDEQIETQAGAVSEDSDSIKEAGAASVQHSEEKSFSEIYVYVCGHVVSPGVYRLEADARICDALKLAGGVSDDGNPEALNQAEQMSDGQTIYVPGIGEEAAQPETAAQDGLIDINTADRESLMTLPGIGESKAEVIIRYREEHGLFQTIEELMEIPGIKEGVFNKMKEYIKCKS
ncbi:MAG: ComEA family DNA-binding protein [Lachnospiraceae bacterium]|nr:ComEA family DNA-binding protein [Lachnospiraceae bacterium]